MLGCSLQNLYFFSLPFGMSYNFSLMARPDVLGKRNCYKQSFSNMVVRCRGGRGEAFYSCMIRSQFLSEPVPVDCELHTVPVSTHPLMWGQDGYSGLEVGIFLFPHGVEYFPSAHVSWALIKLQQGRLWFNFS